MMNQEKALAVLKSGKNVFLTGSAGAGKTYVLNQYIKYLKEHDVPVAVTASTGIAATHMNGMTIHAWAGIGVKDSLGPRDLEAMKEKKYLSDKMDEAQVLIIDEISMLHKQQLDMVNMVLKSFKNNDLAFGGLQVVFSGDFFQLPPVGKPGEEPRDKFAFMSKAWLEAEPCICYLSEQYRQSDNRLNDLLNSIRSGNTGQRETEMLEVCMNRSIPDSGMITRLYTHNVDVDRLNNEYLSRLKSEPVTFKAEVKGNETLRTILKKSVLTEEELELKEGAMVMFVKNNYEQGYMNGSTGELSGFDEDGNPEVTLRSGRTITAEKEEWSIEDDKGKSLASFKQIPLRLAWAITVHKSQGMTLDEAVVDLSKTFESGQGYVALSRLKDMDHLYVEGFNAMSLKVDPLALKADKRFRELSEESDKKWTIEELEKRFKIFIQACGGTFDKKKRKHTGKKKKGAAVKGETYELTADLIMQGKSLKEIADKRGLAMQTIVSHLYKLKDKGTELDLKQFEPEPDIMKKVRKAVKTLRKKQGEDFNPRSLTPVYTELKGMVPFDTLRLAMLYAQD